MNIDRTQKFKRFLKRLWPFLLFLAVSIFLTYPVSLNPSAYVIGRPFDDAFEHIWYLHWYKTALLDLHISPLFQPDIFYPAGWDLSFASLPPLFPTILAPVTAILGPVTTYNLALLASTVLAAYGVFLLVREMGGTAAGGIFAGLLFAFYPNRQVYMHGFLNHLLGSMCLPWMLYAVYQAVKRPQSRGRWLVFAALAYSFSIGGAWQYAFISTFALLIFGLFYLLPSIKREFSTWVKPLLLAAIPILLFAVPLLVNGIMARQRLGSTATFSIDDLTRTSVSLERLFVPSALNPLFLDWVGEAFPLRNGEDGVVTVGFTALILVIVYLIWDRPWSRHTWALSTMAFLGLLFMLGPFWQWQGEPLLIQGAAALRIGEIIPVLSSDQGGIKIPMPALLTYQIVPPLRSFHHFGRLGVVVAWSLGILAGLGLSALQRRFSQRIGLVIAVAGLSLLLLELNSQPISAITAIAGMEREVDHWLKEQPGQSVIMEYPLWYSSKAQSLYYTMAHRQKIIHGYSNISPQYQEMPTLLDRWPDNQVVEVLAEKGVDYVLVHLLEEENDSILSQLTAVDRLAFVDCFPRAVPPEAIPTYLNGHIQPMVDIVQETCVFELVDD